MIRSMTAYGRAEQVVEGKEITVEMKSVNSRYFDCSVKVSKLYGFLEEKIKSHLQNCGVSRGKVDVYVSIDILETLGLEVNLDDAYAGGYIKALRKLRDTYGLADDITVMTVAQNRDIFSVRKPDEDIEHDWQLVKPVLDAAIVQFNAMRENEGANLKNDIRIKSDKLKEMAAQVMERSEVCRVTYAQKLESRLRQTLADLNIEIDSARILMECAIFADKIAVDEELVRLSSHFSTLDKTFMSDEPIGRKLDFLVQEINREINTIGSKANDIEIATIVVDMKSELEKIREQIQNIE